MFCKKENTLDTARTSSKINRIIEKISLLIICVVILTERCNYRQNLLNFERKKTVR